MDQEIFNNVYSLIDEAEEYILIDMFLFNDNYSKKNEYPNLAKILTNKLIEKKKNNSSLKIIFITDKINTFYGSYKNIYLEKMKKNNIDVVMTELDELRNSNFLYSGYWDVLLKRFYRPKYKEGIINSPFGDDKKVSFMSMLKLINFKANHRKTIVTDKSGMIISANPHGASFYHSNIGFKFKGDLLNDLLISELNVIRFSNRKIYENYKNLKSDSKVFKSDIKGKVITESNIKKSLLEYINKTKKDDELKIAMFYLSERDIVESIKKASIRGVNVKVILDPNKDAFGINKNGIPNVSVAKELQKNSKIKLRWYDTNGEQFHSKLIIINYKNESIIIGGSANLTRRNINNFNLETNLLIKSKNTTYLVKNVNNYYEKIFNNNDGIYTKNYYKYKDESLIKEMIYFIQEYSGLSTF
ncbi:MAG: phospholipase D-like domain-containing protein [Bacillota bacterium]